jgi:hypothetical protein
MNYKIKEEWMNKTIKVYSKYTGTRAILTASIDMTKVQYYMSIGLKHIFEEVVTKTTEDVVVIEYKAVEGPIPETTPKPKKKRKTKTDAPAD